MKACFSGAGETLWTPDDEINDYLATLELPPEPIYRQYMAEREAREARAPRVGEQAPAFSVELLTADGRRSGTDRSLSDYLGRPLVLIFGSYTCPIYRGQFACFQAVYDEFRDRLDFLTIYVKEEHPDDGWQLEINERHGCVYTQPVEADARARVAADFMRRFAVQLPVALDSMDNAVCDAYHAEPERLYIIDGDGLVSHQSEPGPFHLDAVQAWADAVREAADSRT